MKQRALVVEDHPIVSDVLVASLSSLQVFQDIVTTRSLAATLKVLDEGENFALIILDLHLPDTEGNQGMIQLRETYPDIPLVIFSGNESTGLIASAFEHGVRGFIPKRSSMAVVINAINMVLAGSFYIPPDAIRMLGFVPATVPEANLDDDSGDINLSPKQQAVFIELMNGMPNKIIAQRLSMAEGTVKTHLHSIYSVLKVRSRAQAILKARELGLL